MGLLREGRPGEGDKKAFRSYLPSQVYFSSTDGRTKA